MTRHVRHLATTTLLLAAVLLGPASRAESATISLVPVPAAVTVGSPFTIEVHIADVTDLFAFNLDLTYDPALVQFDGDTEGPFLATGGLTFFIPGTDDLLGSIASQANTLLGPVPGVGGSGVLSTFSFTALAPGIAPFALANVLLLDSDLDEIAGSVILGTSVTINAVPEPTSLTLLALGLGAAVLRRRS